MKKALIWAALLLVVFVTQGCASGEPKLEDDMAALKSQVWSLQKQTAELGLKISYNSDEIALLSERLKNVEQALMARAEPAPAPVPAPAVTAPSEPAPASIAPAAAEPVAQTQPLVIAQAGVAPEALGADFKDLTPEDMYKKSMDIFNGGDYDNAVAGFEYMIRRYPGSGLAPNAQYWIGEAFYSQKRFARAGEEFKKIISRYPRSEKTPDALLKIGLCKIELGRAEDGQSTLNEVIEKYPESVAATTARKLLSDERMKTQ